MGVYLTRQPPFALLGTASTRPDHVRHECFRLHGVCQCACVFVSTGYMRGIYTSYVDVLTTACFFFVPMVCLPNLLIRRLALLGMAPVPDRPGDVRRRRAPVRVGQVPQRRNGRVPRRPEGQVRHTHTSTPKATTETGGGLVSQEGVQPSPLLRDPVESSSYFVVQDGGQWGRRQ